MTGTRSSAQAFQPTGTEVTIGLVLFFGIMLLGGLAAFYAALVAAPRALADPEHAGFWPVRFGLYVLSAVLGIGWLAGATLLA